MSISKIISSHLILLTFLSLNSKAQVCASNYDNPWEWASHATWFTGDGVFINFPGGTGTPVTSTKAVNLGDNTNHAYEGTAAFSDNNGDLIGWSNGRKLWRADGGNGILVADDLVAGNEGGSVGERSSAVQGIVAVRHPNIPEKIFIFTSDDVLSNTVGPHYTVYDINAQTSTPPVRLQNDLGGNYRGTEQIDATFHANGNDIWVVVRQSGRGGYNNFRSFYSYSLTCNGLNPVPVKSENVVPETGHTYSGGGGNTQAGIWSNDYGRGALKISWDGTKAATGNHITGGSDADEALMVFDFDNATGLLSNCVPFARVPGAWGWDNAYTNWGAAYDVEWAPNSEGLYISSISGGGDLQWFNTAAGSSVAISSSGKMIYNSHRQFTDIKLGGDGNLYAPGGGSNLRQYVFTDINNGNGLTASNIPTGANVSLGLSNTFIPPIDFTDLSGNPTTMDCSDPPYDLGVVWLCSGGSAEDNTVNGWSSNCGACITDPANGIFDPSIAGEGTYKIYYQRGTTCSQIDSIEITVTCENACDEDTTLSNVIAPVCLNQTADLTVFEVTSDPGTWSIVSTPGGSSSANIVGGNTFDANGADEGVYRIRFTLNSAPISACPDSAERNITVNALPEITLSAEPICAGQTLSLDAGNVGSVYQWSSGLVLGGTAQTEEVTTSGPHKVVVTSVITGCIDSAETTISINPVPEVLITSPISACSNGAIETLNATPSGGLWYVNNILSSNQFNPVALGEGTYNIKYVFSNPSGCSDSDSVSVVINVAPEVDLGPSTFFCSGDSVSLNAGPGFSDYEWSSGDSVQVIYVNSPGPISVVVTDANGCSGTSSVHVSANDIPTVELGGSVVVCEQDSVTIGAVHPDAFSYTWLPGTESDATIRVGSEDATYTVTIVDNDGCKFTDSVQISEENLPTVSLGPDTIICDNVTETLDATASSDVAYAWYLDGVIISDENGQTLKADSGEYIVIVSTENGCESSDTINIDNHQLPNVIIDSEYEFCQFDSVEIDLGSVGESYLWTTGDTTQSIWAYSAGVISVEVTDLNSCEVSVNTTLIENLLPVLDLGANDSACVGLEIELNAQPTEGVGPYTFLWSDGSIDPFYNLVGPDTLSVIVTGDNNCAAYDTIGIAALDSLDLSFIPSNNQSCAGAEEDHPLDAGDFPGAIYEWTLPDGSTENTQVIVPLLNGVYAVLITDVFNCKGIGESTNLVVPVPNIDLGPDTSFCSFGQKTHTVEMNFLQNVVGVISWEDSFGGTINNTNNTSFTASSAPVTIIGMFTDSATECYHKDSVFLDEYCEPTIVVLPNIFIPGGESGGNFTFRPIDMTEDNFMEIANNIVWSNFEVFNRWGQKVFQSSNVIPNWDGMFEHRPVASGVYFWVYNYKDLSSKEHANNGFVQVIQRRD